MNVDRAQIQFAHLVASRADDMQPVAGFRAGNDKYRITA